MKKMLKLINLFIAYANEHNDSMLDCVEREDTYNQLSDFVYENWKEDKAIDILDTLCQLSKVNKYLIPIQENLKNLEKLI